MSRLIQKFFCPNHHTIDFFHGDKVSNLQCAKCNTILHQFHSFCVFCGGEKNYSNFQRHQKSCVGTIQDKIKTMIVIISVTPDILYHTHSLSRDLVPKFDSVVISDVVGTFDSMKYQLENHPCRLPYRPIRKLYKKHLNRCIKTEELHNILFLYVCKESIPEQFVELIKMDLSSARTLNDTSYVPATVQRPRKTDIIFKKPNDLIYSVDFVPTQRKLVLVLDPNTTPIECSENVLWSENGVIPVNEIAEYAIRGTLPDRFVYKTPTSTSTTTIPTVVPTPVLTPVPPPLVPPKVRIPFVKPQSKRSGNLAYRSRLTETPPPPKIHLRPENFKMSFEELAYYDSNIEEYNELCKETNAFFDNQGPLIVRKTISDYHPILLLKIFWYLEELIDNAKISLPNVSSRDYVYLKRFQVDDTILYRLNAKFDLRYSIPFNVLENNNFTLDEFYYFFIDIVGAPPSDETKKIFIFPPRHIMKQFFDSFVKIEPLLELKNKYFKQEDE
jgi:hypothetical protein